MHGYSTVSLDMMIALSGVRSTKFISDVNPKSIEQPFKCFISSSQSIDIKSSLTSHANTVHLTRVDMMFCCVVLCCEHSVSLPPPDYLPTQLSKERQRESYFAFFCLHLLFQFHSNLSRETEYKNGQVNPTHSPVGEQRSSQLYTSQPSDQLKPSRQRVRSERHKRHRLDLTLFRSGSD